MRIIFRIGGSVIASPVNTDLILSYVKMLTDLKMKGHEIVVVVGGGNLAREFISNAKKLGLEMHVQDKIAILVSRLFAQLFLKTFRNQASENVAITLDEAEKFLSIGKIVVMGGLKPGITTDTVAALVAEKLNADLLVKGTNQDGIYDKDPRKYPEAVKLDFLSFEELSNVFFGSKHHAGINQIIDPEAIKVLKRNRVKLVVVNGFNPENLLLAVEGKKIGTLVS